MLVKAQECERIIIQDIGAYDDYPFEALSEEVLNVIDQAIERRSAISKNFNGQIRPVIRALECFLQITGHQLSLSDLNNPIFRITCQQFVGAVHSGRFISGVRRSLYNYGHMMSVLLAELNQLVPVSMPNFCLSSVGATDFVAACISQFEELDLEEEKVWLWRGWPSTNRNGKTMCFPLYPIYKRLGREFTQRLHAVCDDYFSGRKCDTLVALKELTQFIYQYPEDLVPQLLNNPLFVSQFWRKFFTYYIKTKYVADVRTSTSIKAWGLFLSFVREYLIPSGLFAEPYGELPSPEQKKVPGSRTHIRHTEDGIEIKTKLLTDIPLHVTDQEAIEFLFVKIQADHDVIVNCALWSVRDIWKRYQRRLQLAPHGKVRVLHTVAENGSSDGKMWLMNRQNPDYLKNAAATFEHYGFKTTWELPLVRLYPTGLTQTAEDLALPISGALLPHCILLVANHPKITPSFLEKLMLYDKNGKLVGFIKTDAGYILDGRKDRRGPSRSQQIIELNNQTSTVISQMIELTDPLRKYLRERGDDNWRYLLLSCGSAFSYPNRVRRLASDTSRQPRVEALADSMANTCELSREERLGLAKRFSLPALRASAGVLIYIKEKSVKKMSEALGHAECSSALLSRYLPEPILAFFQERWIRIFQEGFIVKALKDSAYLLEASSFSSMTELNEFLMTHALKTIPKHLENPYKKEEKAADISSQNEVVFGINTGILTVMISLQIAVRRAKVRVNARAFFWAGITECLVKYLESEQCNRTDLKSYLKAARHRIDPSKMEVLIYE